MKENKGDDNITNRIMNQKIGNFWAFIVSTHYLLSGGDGGTAERAGSNISIVDRVPSEDRKLDRRCGNNIISLVPEGMSLGL